MGEQFDYSVGHLRMKYLHSANEVFAQGNYLQCEGYIKAFLDTIPDDKPVASFLSTEFDIISKRKKDQVLQLQQHLKTLGYLEAKDTETRGRDEVEINAIHDKKVACWRIAMKEGLFFD